MSSRYQNALDALTALGYVSARADFQGGNDEGGVESITAIKADGTEVDLPGYIYTPSIYDPETRTWRDGEPNSDLNRDHIDLINLLNKPVDDEFGSFAGDFYVSGYVFFDVAANKVTMNGEEEIKSNRSFGEEF